MYVTGFFILILLASLLALARRRLSASFLYALALLTFWIFGAGLGADFLLRALQDVETSANLHWGRHNALILLGGGVVEEGVGGPISPNALAYGRIFKTLQLYKSCVQASQITGSSCLVVVSGGDPFKSGKTEASVYGELLTEAGVNSQDLLLEDKSRNTHQNAELTSQILEGKNIDRAFVITSAYHINRALLHFKHFGISAQPIPAAYMAPMISWIPNGYNLALVDLSIKEYVGRLRYYIYNYFSWNVPPKASILVE